MTSSSNANVLDQGLLGEEEEDTLSGKFLTFRLGREDFGLEIRYVTEIVGLQKITELPDMPGYVKGVINLRGAVIPVIDVRVRFRLEPREYDERTCIVVAQLQNRAMGLVVDQVNEVTEIPAGQIEPPPRAGSASGGGFIQGLGKIGEDVKILLDTEKLLSDQELDLVSSLAAD
ncbi:MAG: chemotaxis protein CheW [Desulfuromonas sp.]|uniref:chemotaxis protein CheW n=1 Tax=Desulfuromonas sp. TaxID=892 RepID=UPI000CBAC1D5|nr:chemotaxis protein CheW [Desulfuromonas sp.]PLX84509.1 MAG: chemotaxis protein CheW [Desulfuromonas sp.]